MAIKTFFESIEDEKPSQQYVLSNQDLDQIEESVPFIKKLVGSFNGVPETWSWEGEKHFRRDGLMGLKKDNQGFDLHLISPGSGREIAGAFDYKKIKNGIGPTFEKLEKEAGIEIIPDLFEGNLKLEFIKNEKLDPGQFKMDPLKDFDKKHQITFECNYNSLTQVKEIIKGSLKEFMELCKNVRIVIVPRYFIKNREFKKDLKEEFKSIYLELLEKFEDQGFLSVDDIDNDILGLVLLKVAKDNEEYLEILNDLPEDIKSGFFRYAKKIFGDNPITFNKDSIKMIRNLYDLKPVWDLI